MVNFFRTWKKTSVAIAIVTALALPGCTVASTAYNILKATNPIVFLLDQFIIGPVLESLKKPMEEFGERMLARLPPGLRKTVNTVRKISRQVEAFRKEVTEMKALRALVKKEVDKARDSVLLKTGIVKTLTASREVSLGALQGKTDGLIKQRNKVNAQLSSNNVQRKKSSGSRAKKLQKENAALLKRKGEISAELAKSNAELEKTRKASLAQLNQAKQELAAAKTKAAEQEKKLKNRDREIAKLNAKLAVNEKKLGASRASMQKQMLAMEAENEGLRKQHEELLQKINASNGVSRSPIVFKAGSQWDETKDTIQQVKFKEKEFQRVDWADQITDQFKDWNPDIKPIEVEMQQNVMYTAMVMKEDPDEFKKLEDEIKKKVLEEAEQYDFNVVRKKQ